MEDIELAVVRTKKCEFERLKYREPILMAGPGVYVEDADLLKNITFSAILGLYDGFRPQATTYDTREGQQQIQATLVRRGQVSLCVADVIGIPTAHHKEISVKQDAMIIDSTTEIHTGSEDITTFLSHIKDGCFLPYFEEYTKRYGRRE